MNLAYYGHRFEELQNQAKQQQNGQRPSLHLTNVSKSVPTPELANRNPVDVFAQVDQSHDSLDECDCSPTGMLDVDHVFHSDRSGSAKDEYLGQVRGEKNIRSGESSLPLVGQSIPSEGELNEAIVGQSMPAEANRKEAIGRTELKRPKDLEIGATDNARTDMFGDFAAEVRAGVREEIAMVLVAVEALRCEMVERWRSESQVVREDTMMRKDTSVTDLENLNSSIEEIGEESYCSHTEQGSRNGRALTSPESSVPRGPSVDDNDVRRSLLSPNTGDEPTAGGYFPLVADDAQENIDLARVEKLQKEIERLAEEEEEKAADVQRWEAHCEKRRSEFSAELADIQQRKDDLQKQLVGTFEPAGTLAEVMSDDDPVPLAWVDSSAFINASMCVIILNLGMMLARPGFSSQLVWVCDQLFLLWYVLELSLKSARHGQALFSGSISVVWWNWLDLGIVVIAIVDQWILGLWEYLMRSESAINLDILRVARLFRLLRALRFVKMFLRSDTSWVDGVVFRNLLLGTIIVNSAVMSLELDIEWDGWQWVENCFLLIYFAELLIRIKHGGKAFFRFSTDSVWNYIDLSMVVGGMLDLWLMPLFHVVQNLVVGKSVEEPAILKRFAIFFKAFGIVRVLRLVRLMREMTPLYVLFTEFYYSLRALRWVLLLILMVLYVGAIVFTDLIGRGYLYGEVKPPMEAFEVFGSFGASMFSLFRLMNGDSNVVDPFTNTISGKLLFVSFMVVFNWSLLAIMTSTVSDHLITTSAKQQKQERQDKVEEDFKQRSIRLNALFRSIDVDGSGYITKDEWDAMMSDSILVREFCDASKLEIADLDEFYRFLSEDTIGGTCINYNIFMRALSDERVLATKAMILHVLSHLRHVEAELETGDQSTSKKRISHVNKSAGKKQPSHANSKRTRKVIHLL